MRLLTLTFLTVAWVFCGNCYSQQQTNWGPAVAGVRLSIAATNNVFASGSSATLTARIENASTNTVAVADTGSPLRDLHVAILDSDGAAHEIRPGGPFALDLIRNGWISVAPGAIREWAVRLAIDKATKPGVLRLKATQPFLPEINGRRDAASRREAESNALEIHVTK